MAAYVARRRTGRRDEGDGITIDSVQSATAEGLREVTTMVPLFVGATLCCAQAGAVCGKLSIKLKAISA